MPTISCRFCRGKGRVRALALGQALVTMMGSDECDVCEGTGYISVPDDYKNCKSCRGSGREHVLFVSELAGPQRCSTCNGAGVVGPPRYG